MQVGLDPLSFHPSGLVDGLGREIQADRGAARPSLHLGEQAPEVGRPHLGPRGAVVG